jgi:hypothetical protein
MRDGAKKVSIVACTILLFACSSQVASSKTSAPSPKDQWVQPFSDDHSVVKRCDGSTLMYKYAIYSQGGLAVIPDSAECK